MPPVRVRGDVNRSLLGNQWLPNPRDKRYFGSMLIKYFSRPNQQVEHEKVYGEGFVSFLYDSAAGQATWPIFTSSVFSKLYGAYQDTWVSRYKVKSFIKKFNIPIDDYEPSEKGNFDFPYPSFNDFFIRKFKPGKRTFEPTLYQMPSPSEARYLGWSKVTEDQKFPVKGKFLSAEKLLEHPKWVKYFQGGPLVIARLCPVDYHRFHYMDDGVVEDYYGLRGQLHSVNPLALKYKDDIFCSNERVVSILNTKNFGKIAYIEVGATCVGKIHQSHDIKTPFKRGDEKGYFLFGGSTVILMGEPGKWTPSDDILENTSKRMETYIHLGSQIAKV